MSPRRRRRRPAVTFLIVLLVGAAVGAGILSLVLRSQDGPPPLLTRPDVRVEVLNGCGVDGAADRVASKLRRGGFQVDRIGAADHYHYREDVVVVRGTADAHAGDIARILDGARIVRQVREGHPFDLTVIVGRAHPLVPPR